jgi:catechol 2,3-dioxygenase-like lactoylglutathione lyase family enzyme
LGRIYAASCAQIEPRSSADGPSIRFAAEAVITPSHVAFAAGGRAEVEAFYRAAMEAGARDFGAPGVRAHYHPNHYAAFVVDPDGHDIEAVYHGSR